jgi:hypothetical protein
MNKKIQKTILFLILASLFLSLNPTIASVVSTNYQKYKSQYKNKKDKATYFKIRTLKERQSQTFSHYKSICDSHKYDTQKQFEKLSKKTQTMCSDY